MLNDYLDLEHDRIYQPNKILVRGDLSPSELKYAILIFASLILILTVIIFPLRVILLIICGTILAQLYNFGLKDTPFSLVVFSASFGMMAFLPFLLRPSCYLCDVSPLFLIAGGIITTVLHIANCQIDIETDTSRGSHNFVITLGKSYITILLIILLLILSVMYWGFILVVLLEIVAIGLVILELNKPVSIKQRELIYYVAILCNLVVFIRIPILLH